MIVWIERHINEESKAINLLEPIILVILVRPVGEVRGHGLLDEGVSVLIEVYRQHKLHESLMIVFFICPILKYFVLKSRRPGVHHAFFKRILVDIRLI